MNRYLYLSLAFLSILSASAQTTRAPVCLPSLPPISSIEKAKKIAQNEVTRLKTELAQLYNQDDYRPCQARSLEIQKSYQEWFLAHIPQFESEYRALSNQLTGTNLKLDLLKKESISVSALEGQKSELTLTLDALVKYFQRYNKRIKVCSKDERAQLDLDMQVPERTGLGMGHQQVVAATSLLADRLNASLKSTSAEYQLYFGPSDCGFDFELRLKINFNGEIIHRKFSLLNTDAATQQPQLEITEEAIWTSLIESRKKIDGYPLDGLARYRLFLHEQKGACTTLKPVPNTVSNAPYVEFDQIDHFEKQRQKNGTDPYRPNAIVLYSDDHCKNQVYAFFGDEASCSSLSTQVASNAQVWSISINGKCQDLPDTQFEQICPRALPVTKEPSPRKALLSLHRDDSCTQTWLHLDTDVQYDSFGALFGASSQIWSVQGQDYCIDIPDIAFDPKLVKQWVEAAKYLKDRDPNLKMVKLFRDDQCRSKVMEITRNEACSTLNPLFGTEKVWSVMTENGVCQDITDTNFTGACPLYSR